MHLLKLYLMSVCCLASVNVLAYGLAIDNDSETSSSSSSVETDQAKASTATTKTTINTTNPKQTALVRKAIKSNKHSHILNKKLLNKLGLAKVRAPNSHNRKRLAVESRRHASPDDSHMFIIKLPPNLYYYTSPKAGAGTGTGTGTDSSTGTSTAAKNNALDQGNGKKVSFNFNSNGKPSRIYHWNLPVLKKILSDESRFPTLRSKDELIDIKNFPTWTKPWENETIEKSYGKSSLGEKKSLKRKSPSYYAPSNVVTKNSFKKYFPGNGKPKGFYVLKGNHNKKSATYYRNITP